MAYTDLNLSKVLIPRRLKIRSELTGDIDIEDDAPADTGDDRALEDATTFGGAILFSGCTHQRVNGRVGTAQLDGKGVDAEGFLTRLGLIDSIPGPSREGKGVMSELAVFLSGHLPKGLFEEPVNVCHFFHCKKVLWFVVTFRRS